MLKQATRTKLSKKILLTFNTLKVENKNLINKNVMKWMFSHWPCYRSSASRIDLRMTVLALGFASGQFSNPQANTIALGPVTVKDYDETVQEYQGLYFLHWTNSTVSSMSDCRSRGLLVQILARQQKFCGD